VTSRAHRRRSAAAACGGFTIIELLVTILIIGLITALVAPNLEAFVPKARIDAAAQVLVANVDYMRSEARIQSKRCTLELDLKGARWRRVMPPEQQLTTDQDVDSLEPKHEEWTPLEEDVVFVGAGNPVDGIVREGTFKMVFDENGFTSDQSVVLALVSDPKMVWTVRIRGLTGQCDVVPDFDGKEHLVDETGEGAF
jgi:prepilin-type N-terminal cleavage/methylation domain-containing protein